MMRLEYLLGLVGVHVGLPSRPRLYFEMVLAGGVVTLEELRPVCDCGVDTTMPSLALAP
jgi:hypothetical protein